jgi:hypothetical protein
MTRMAFEAGKLLAWLRELLRGAETVDVDVVVVDKAESRSWVQITLHDVPGPLAGLDVAPPADDRPNPVA